MREHVPLSDATPLGEEQFKDWLCGIAQAASFLAATLRQYRQVFRPMPTKNSRLNAGAEVAFHNIAVALQECRVRQDGAFFIEAIRRVRDAAGITEIPAGSKNKLPPLNAEIGGAVYCCRNPAKLAAIADEESCRLEEQSKIIMDWAEEQAGGDVRPPETREIIADLQAKLAKAESLLAEYESWRQRATEEMKVQIGRNALLVRAKKMLERFEWNEVTRECPDCYSREARGHCDDCELVKLLGELKQPCSLHSARGATQAK
jgi:hypothetical protein